MQINAGNLSYVVIFLSCRKEIYSNDAQFRRLELPLTVFLDYENPLWTSESMLYSSGDMIFLPNLYVCLIVFHIFKVYFEV